MHNLKEIRNRIASVQSTQKITSAMKLVSASKLRHIQSEISQLRNYSEKLNTLLQKIITSMGKVCENTLFAKREPNNIVLITVTSNRGLCGAFNTNIMKEVQNIVAEKYQQQQKQGTLKLICFGAKAVEQLHSNFEIVFNDNAVIETHNFEEIEKISSGIMRDFAAKKIDKLEIIYNRFVNATTQQVVIESFLPIESRTEEVAIENRNADYIFQPSQRELINEIIPKVVTTKLYTIIIDSIAAEHGARMTAMAKATDNAVEILKDLKLKYNNARQDTITNELNEIVGGAEALTS